MSASHDDLANSVEGQPARRATIADVARLAGVSVGTVSAYLNGGASIRRGNRERIEQAVAALGYQRNLQAAAIKGAHTKVVGLMVPEFNEFHAGVLERLSRLVRRGGRALLSYCHDADPATIAEALDFFSEQRVDAVIMTGVDGQYDHIDRLKASGTPIILYDVDMPGVAADRVFVENRKAARNLTRYLTDLGHRRVAVLAGNLAESTQRERVAGYEQALHEARLPVEPRYVIDRAWRATGGHDAMEHLLELDPRPTAVFATNYPIAVGALNRLKERGLIVPNDLSFVSFDDVPLFYLHDAGITAAAQPVAAIAEAIADLLEQRLRAPEESRTRTVVLDCNIILRGSAQRHIAEVTAAAS